jgi:hypothetical protein
VRKPEDVLENGDPKRLRTHSGPHLLHDSIFRSPEYSPSCRTYAAIDPALGRPAAPPAPPAPPAAAHATATTTDTLLQTEVYNSHEALLTLIEAAGKDTMKGESRSPSTESSPPPPPSSSNHSHVPSPVQTLSSAAAAPPRWSNQKAHVHFSGASNECEAVSAIPTAAATTATTAATASSHAGSHLHRRSNSGVSPKSGTERLPLRDDGTDKAIRAWNKFRFVKAGWFGAREAIGYVE